MTQADYSSVVEDNPNHFDVILDTKAPAVTFSIAGGDSFTRDPLLPLSVGLDAAGQGSAPEHCRRAPQGRGLDDQASQEVSTMPADGRRRAGVGASGRSTSSSTS